LVLVLVLVLMVLVSIRVAPQRRHARDGCRCAASVLLRSIDAARRDQ